MITEEQIKAILANDFWITDQTTVHSDSIHDDMDPYYVNGLYSGFRPFLSNQNYQLCSFSQTLNDGNWALNGLTYTLYLSQVIEYTFVLRHKINDTTIEIWLGLDSIKTVSNLPGRLQDKVNNILSSP